ncbi:MAG: SPOR domain-containing protein [Candidatus Cloacimonadales bacterium]|nr:SPOR domain-containing protein [Candidatus Cloacimonadales bacterium]
MRNIPALIVIIIAIVAIIIVIGFTVASIMHKYTTKDMNPEVVTQVENIPELDQKIYSLQLFASNNYSSVEHQKEKLEKQGYDTNVMKTLKDGEILYRLRLDGLYGENEAIALGEEIKRKFPSIQNYWLDQVGSESERPVNVAETRQIEQSNKEKPIEQQTVQEQVTQKPPIGETQYEVQLMASSNYAKIEDAKGALSRLGYETKIVNKTEGTKVVYRLRLKTLYSKSDAITLGEKIIKDSPLISGYWLDEIKDGKSVPNQQQISKTVEPVKTQTTTKSIDTGQKIYEIQLLANTKLDAVEKRKKDLENKGYSAKILSIVVKGTTFYRLRLNESFTQTDARDLGEILKKNVSFVKDYWIVKKSPDDKIVTTTGNTVKKEVPKQETKKVTTKTVPPKEEEKLPVETDVSANPNYQSTIVDYSASCNSNEVNIRTGPGAHFEIDPIGKLMQGITVFVVEEKTGWARFTITPNDESWSGWVNLEYLDKN